jgi:hypothetical protein
MGVGFGVYVDVEAVDWIIVVMFNRNGYGKLLVVLGLGRFIIIVLPMAYIQCNASTNSENRVHPE